MIDILNIRYILPLLYNYFPYENYMDLEDAVQDAYLRIITSRGKDEFNAHYAKALILQTAKRCHLNFIRDRKNECVAPIDSLNEWDILTCPLDSTSMDIDLFLDSITIKNRQVFILTLDGWTPKEIAKEIGISVDTTYKRIQICKKKILEWLEIYKTTTIKMK